MIPSWVMLTTYILRALAFGVVAIALIIRAYRNHFVVHRFSPFVWVLGTLMVMLSVEQIARADARIHYMQTGVLQSLDTVPWLALGLLITAAACAVGIAFRYAMRSK